MGPAGGDEVIRAMIHVAITAGMLLSHGLLASLYSQAGSVDIEGEEVATYQEALREKVGEVAEYRYKELVESKTEKSNGDRAMLRLALYRYFLRDYSGSEFYLRKLIRRFEESELTWEARLWMGRTYLARGELRAALVELRGGLQKLEGSEVEDQDLIARYLFWIGESYLRSKKRSDARDYFERLSEEIEGEKITGLPLGKLKDVYESLGMKEAASTLDVERVNTIFMVQAGSFSTRENASEMVMALEYIGLEADIHSVEISNGLYYRVVLGGYDNREVAEEIVAKILKEGYGKALIEERNQ